MARKRCKVYHMANSANKLKRSVIQHVTTRQVVDISGFSPKIVAQSKIIV